MMAFCGSGHAVVDEEAIQASGLCIMCEIAYLRKSTDELTVEAPICPRCEEPLPFDGAEIIPGEEAADNVDPSIRRLTLATRWGACRNHADGSQPVQPDVLAKSFSEGIAP